MEVRGVFSTYDLTDIEKETFAEYFEHTVNSPWLEFIKYILGDDYLRFLDILSGTTLKIPSPRILERDLENVRVFLIAKKNNFSDEGIRIAAKTFGKTALSARRAIYKVSKVLGVEDTLEGDDLNNFIMYIKNPEEGDHSHE
jgi:hypothetical protein